MNKNYITRLLILLIALHISSCANTSSRQPSPELEKIDIAQELKTQTKAQLLKKLYRPENSKYAKSYNSSHLLLAIGKLYVFSKQGTPIQTLLSDLDKAGIPYQKVKDVQAGKKFINRQATKLAKAQGSSQDVYYIRDSEYLIQQHVYPLTGADTNPAIDHYLQTLSIKTTAAGEIIDHTYRRSPLKKRSYYSQQLQQKIEQQDKQALLAYLKDTYPHNTDANQLIQDLEYIGASLEERKTYTDKFRFYVFRYTSKHTTWWQELRGIEAVVTTILLKTTSDNKIIAWDRLNKLAISDAISLPHREEWQYKTNISFHSDRYLESVAIYSSNSCCQYIDIVPIYNALDLNDYYTPLSAQAAMLYHYPLGTDIQLIIKEMKQLGFKKGSTFPKTDNFPYSRIYIYGNKSGYIQDYFIGGGWTVSLYHDPEGKKLAYLGMNAKVDWLLATRGFKFYAD